jgi:acyl-CoA synthetase (NDP forming)
MLEIKSSVFDQTSLEALFRPRSVAVIGASTNPNKVGGRPLVFLRRAGYAGAVYPVHPAANEIHGYACYRSIVDVSGPVEHAIVAVALGDTLDAIKQCAEKGVKAVQIFTSGFAETGALGRELQERVVALARSAGIRLIGPNSLGLFNVQTNFFGTFATMLDGSWPTAGNVSFVSQSGGFGSLCYLLTQARGLGYSHFITTGNEADVSLADCIAYLAEDSCTQVIVAAFESCRDGRRLIAAMEQARNRGKAVIVMKLGVTDAGAKSVQSHTGALAGADEVYDAAFRQFHVYRARTLDDLVDSAYAASRGRPPRGSRLGVVTYSGGVGVLAADAAIEQGLELPSLSKGASESIKALLPGASTGNPLDTSAALVNDLSLYARIVEIVLKDTDCDILFGYLAAVGRNPQHYAQLKGPLFEVRRRYPEKLFVLTMACTDEVRAELESEGFLWYAEPRRAIVAVAAMTRLARGFKTQSPRAVSAPRVSLLPGPLDEVQSKALLAKVGVSVPKERLTHDAQEACEAARQLGFPVALKIVSPDIPHKSDIGGVRLDLRDESEVLAAFSEITQKALSKAPAARCAGVLVTPMMHGGVETILGVARDPVFGPVVMFGLGGAYVELMKDVSFRVAPFDADTARDMISETLAGRALQGMRGAPPADVTNLAATLARLAAFAYANANVISSIDVNPYVVNSSGGYALDALVVPI